MKGIITVLGKDHVGIIGTVCTHLSRNSINILDISQTIVGGYLNMMMIVDLSAAKKEFTILSDELVKLGEDMNVIVKMQHEDIFNSMHRV
ncbi:MAG: ACT domain-containing protein [Firmicutes bacterium]|jgi:ACT domain-containing protein|nr:ACT domain-containing protein [Bacillota bacterium]